MKNISQKGLRLPPGLEVLLNRAREAARNAFAHYSSFRVGASLMLAGDEIMTGANVEHAT